MKEFIDKLIERLEEHCAIKNEVCDCNGVCSECDFKASIEIVTELAEEYNVSEMPTGSEDCCEWKADEKFNWFIKSPHEGVGITKEEHVLLKFCPYCGKKIKVAPYTEGE